MPATLSVVRKTFIKVPSHIRGPKHVKVGFPAGKAGGDVVARAIWNHYGTRGGGWGGPIPARPFLSNAMRDNRKKYVQAMLASASKLMRSKTTLGAVMPKLGILAQGDIQSEITTLSSPPNSPVTVARKGSSNPLIDSGEMRGAVTWKVEE
ncbi:hypothetical protein CSC94_12715 [Zhengella mangrovi]|uniref:Uncharacterized protein n=1 Tax=Zhengella mangrovi TaxID=1982044 RepID=A0A2G1QLY4_9HYPH|nr:hypothetical protein [Zhengella mangrovi]PHP66545.1 hypothetical protein CSC94_12715 [Zhengella mangrovi]